MVEGMVMALVRTHRRTPSFQLLQKPIKTDYNKSYGTFLDLVAIDEAG